MNKKKILETPIDNSSPHLLTKILSVARAKPDLGRFFAPQQGLLLWQPRIPYCHPPGWLIIFQVSSCWRQNSASDPKAFQSAYRKHLQGPRQACPSTRQAYHASLAIFWLKLSMKPGIYPTDFGLKISARWFSTHHHFHQLPPHHSVMAQPFSHYSALWSTTITFIVNTTSLSQTVLPSLPPKLSLLPAPAPS